MGRSDPKHRGTQATEVGPGGPRGEEIRAFRQLGRLRVRILKSLNQSPKVACQRFAYCAVIGVGRAERGITEGDAPAVEKRPCLGEAMLVLLEDSKPRCACARRGPSDEVGLSSPFEVDRVA